MHSKMVGGKMLTAALLLVIGCLEYPVYLEACSSRTVPKPRPSISSSSMSGTALPPTQAPVTSTTMRTTTTTTTPRPNITFPTYKCPETFDAWYCLNDAHCFAVKIADLPVYSCECATGFMGQRCEYKEIDNTYLPKRPRPMLEKASIASGAMCALVFMLFVCLAFYLRFEQRAAKKAYELEQEEEQEYDVDEEHCECCRNQCCPGGDEPPLIAEQRKLPYHMRLEHALVSFAIRRSNKL
ncbi:protein spitz [Drosophila serrata]|uniref:protein spitz n=1 Tax=Drosophila serrata TaxID=7274 RepID=UPI000A1D2B2A|nr:protein spitz [Drosophila serrata]XP_020810649.1 protein spitz [Drosophila serrata]XP_020810650.1 protein spitz [Drosophila serrata]XP_020810651.1 protein spitz [Drosophila serrata]XP_020810652.1 protein spitz [Drosophila serrata]